MSSIRLHQVLDSNLPQLPPRFLVQFGRLLVAGTVFTLLKTTHRDDREVAARTAYTTLPRTLIVIFAL